jgi:putative FmdB family regulatory protein
MPLYPYQCDKCGHETEVVRKVEDRDKRFTCGQPNGKELCMGTYKKIVALTGPPSFKGYGWTRKFH